jgi:uncharacterized protein YdhG (YjbR/CyaY superfamily)
MSDIAAFLEALPEARRREVARVRAVIRRSLPAGYEEVISNRMLVYQVPLKRYSDTYNGHPLWYAALASEKSYLSLHLMPVYGSKPMADRLAAGFRAAGKKLDMGKACVRFQAAADLDLDTIADIVSAIPIDRWIETAKSARAMMKKRRRAE